MRRAALAAALALALAPGAQAQLAVGTQPQSTPPAPAAGNAVAQGQLDRFARARDNYAAIRDGRRAVGDLSAEELQDLLDLDRRVRGEYPDSRTPEKKCIDNEVRRARGQLSPLAWQVIRLKCR